MRDLTPKQLQFAHYVAEGLTASEAYRRVYSGRGNANTTKKEASEVRTNKAVAEYITQLRKELKEASQMTREDVLATLDRLIKDPDVTPTARVAAIKARNEMTGDNAPQEVNVFGLADLLTLVRTKAKR
jgi:molecular chaperone DnaK (HSP70)